MRTNRLVLERFSLVGDDLDRRGLLSIVSRFNLFLWFYLSSFLQSKAAKAKHSFVACYTVWCCFFMYVCYAQQIIESYTLPCTDRTERREEEEKKWGRRKKIRMKKMRCIVNDFSFDFRPSCLPHERPRRIFWASFHSRISTSTHTHTHMHTYYIHGDPHIWTRPVYQKINSVFAFVLYFIYLSLFISISTLQPSHDIVSVVHFTHKKVIILLLFQVFVFLYYYYFFLVLLFFLDFVCRDFVSYLLLWCALQSDSMYGCFVCIGFAWLPNIFHFGIIRARELLLVFFSLPLFIFKRSHTHTLTRSKCVAHMLFSLMPSTLHTYSHSYALTHTYGDRTTGPKPS